MPKAEISWKGRTAAGEKREVYAQHVGARWIFYERQRRYEPWQELPEPPLEDWLALLDAVERRVRRRLLRPEEPERVRQAMRQQYPDAESASASPGSASPSAADNGDEPSLSS